MKTNSFTMRVDSEVDDLVEDAIKLNKTKTNKTQFTHIAQINELLSRGVINSKKHAEILKRL